MSWLYAIPMVPLAALVVAWLLASLELGRWLGRIAPFADPEASALAPSILALVGLLLAFSFGMAGDRHALRRAAAVQEANSIGTYWLRTSLLSEPIRSHTRARLRRYVDVHLQHRRAGIDEQQTRRLEAEAARLQQEVWALLMQDATNHPEASRIRLLTPSLNAMIDDAATVLAARENRLPDAMFLYLFLLVAVAGVVIAYRPRGERRSMVLWVIFTVVLGGMLMVLVDIDSPRRGLIQTGTGPHDRLRASMQEEPP